MGRAVALHRRCRRGLGRRDSHPRSSPTSPARTAGVDFYHAYAANGTERLLVADAGDYQVSWITPVNADRVHVPGVRPRHGDGPGGRGLRGRPPRSDASSDEAASTEGDGSQDLPYTFERIEAADVSGDDLEQVVRDVAEAVRAATRRLWAMRALPSWAASRQTSRPAPRRRGGRRGGGQETAAAPGDRQSGSSTASAGPHAEAKLYQLQRRELRQWRRQQRWELQRRQLHARPVAAIRR